MENEVLQVLVIVGKGMQRGALLKVINPDGSEAEVHHHVSMDIQPDEFRGDSFQFAKRHGEPSFVVLANFMKHKLGFTE